MDMQTFLQEKDIYSSLGVTFGTPKTLTHKSLQAWKNKILSNYGVTSNDLNYNEMILDAGKKIEMIEALLSNREMLQFYTTFSRDVHACLDPFYKEYIGSNAEQSMVENPIDIYPFSVKSMDLCNNVTAMAVVCFYWIIRFRNDLYRLLDSPVPFENNLITVIHNLLNSFPWLIRDSNDCIYFVDSKTRLAQSQGFLIGSVSHGTESRQIVSSLRSDGYDSRSHEYSSSAFSTPVTIHPILNAICKLSPQCVSFFSDHKINQVGSIVKQKVHIMNDWPAVSEYHMQRYMGWKNGILDMEAAKFYHHNQISFQNAGVKYTAMYTKCFHTDIEFPADILSNPVWDKPLTHPQWKLWGQSAFLPIVQNIMDRCPRFMKLIDSFRKEQKLSGNDVTVLDSILFAELGRLIYRPLCNTTVVSQPENGDPNSTHIPHRTLLLLGDCTLETNILSDLIQDIMGTHRCIEVTYDTIDRFSLQPIIGKDIVIYPSCHSKNKMDMQIQHLIAQQKNIPINKKHSSIGYYTPPRRTLATSSIFSVIRDTHVQESILSETFIPLILCKQPNVTNEISISEGTNVEKSIYKEESGFVVLLLLAHLRGLYSCHGGDSIKAMNLIPSLKRMRIACFKIMKVFSNFTDSRERKKYTGKSSLARSLFNDGNGNYVNWNGLFDQCEIQNEAGEEQEEEEIEHIQSQQSDVDTDSNSQQDQNNMFGKRASPNTISNPSAKKPRWTSSRVNLPPPLKM